jgi:hypothetical protein
MPATTTVWVTALVFGAILGWALGRRRADGGVILGAALATAAAGAALWLTGPSAGSESAMAAVSMTIGGASVAVTSFLAGRQSPGRDPR